MQPVIQNRNWLYLFLKNCKYIIERRYEKGDEADE